MNTAVTFDGDAGLTAQTGNQKRVRAAEMWRCNCLAGQMPFKICLIKAVVIQFMFPHSLSTVERRSTVIKVLCYKSEGRWFDPSWCHWSFSLT